MNAPTSARSPRLARVLLAAAALTTVVTACGRIEPGATATPASTPPSASTAPASPASTAVASAAIAQTAAAPPRRSRGVATSGPVRIGPVVIDPQTVDFGLVQPNTLVETVVTITNASDEPVHILDSVPSCQCTSVDMKGTVIEPGETVPMPMSMKTSSSTGIRQANVRLLIEGLPQVISVDIKSEVAYPVRAVPPYIDIQQRPRTATGQTGPPRPLRGTVAISSMDKKPFKVLSFHGRPPEFVDFDPDRDPARNTYVLVYDFTATQPGSVPAYQIIETDREDCPVMEMRVRHENTHIRPAFKLGGYCANAGRIRPGTSGEFDLEIKEFAPNSIVSVVPKSSDANVEILEQNADDSSVLVRMKVTPRQGYNGLLYFPLTLFSSDGKQSDLRVFATVR